MPYLLYMWKYLSRNSLMPFLDRRMILLVAHPTHFSMIFTCLHYALGWATSGSSSDLKKGHIISIKKMKVIFYPKENYTQIVRWIKNILIAYLEGLKFAWHCHLNLLPREVSNLGLSISWINRSQSGVNRDVISSFRNVSRRYASFVVAKNFAAYSEQPKRVSVGCARERVWQRAAFLGYAVWRVCRRANETHSTKAIVDRERKREK